MKYFHIVFNPFKYLLACKKRRGFILPAIAFLFSAFLTGCSGQSTSDAEQALRQHIDSQSGGQIKLVSFKKTDGQKSEVMGVQCYNLDYEAEIAFVSDGVWQSHSPWAGRGLTFTVTKTDVGFGGMNGATQVHARDRLKIGGVMNGQKKESGWIFDVGDIHSIGEIQINQATPVARPNNSTSEANQQTSQPKASDAEALLVVKALKQISDAKVNWALYKGKMDGAIATEDDLKPFLGQFPVHPLGGHYIINPVGQPPESSKYGKFDQLEAKFHDQLYPPPPPPQFEEMTPDQLKHLVANDLRQIDEAKNQWALQNGKNIGDTPKEADLGSFLTVAGFSNMVGNRLPVHPPGGHFIINPIGTPPESSTYGKMGSF